MISKLISTLALIFGVIQDLLILYQQSREEKKAEEQLMLEARVQYLKAKEEADEIKNSPVPNDKHNILDGM